MLTCGAVFHTVDEVNARRTPFSLTCRKKRDLKKELELFTEEIGDSLNWSFYKEDILYPHLVDDIDLVCEENEELVTRVMEEKGYTKLSRRMFRKYSLKYHFHYNKETHTEIFGKDIGDLILKNTVKKRVYTPKYHVWLYARLAYAKRKPRKWLIKNCKRIVPFQFS